jgi:molybdate transport system ATP-binding protein
MSVVLEAITLRLAPFTLEVTAEMAAPVTGLFGPSGSGKTTVLELIAGLRMPEGGRILLDGTEITSLPARERRVGYVPQDDALFPHLSVSRNIRYGASAEPIEHIAEVLEIVPLLGRGVRKLSGGERKRVALARALASSPRLLLLDEPLAGVDHALRDRVLTYLRRIRDEFAIPMIYVAHDPLEVRAICDEVVVMEGGQVVDRWVVEGRVTNPP